MFGSCSDNDDNDILETLSYILVFADEGGDDDCAGGEAHRQGGRGHSD